MPTAGTHITVVEQLVLKYPELKVLLGDPDPRIDDEMMCYTKLGAVGPDLFYMLGDYNIPIATSLQDMLTFLVKVAGSFACFSDLSEQINRLIIKEVDESFLGLVKEAQQTVNLTTGVITNGFLASLVDNNLNLWGYFGAAARQWGHPPTEWFWADYLHYYRTGDFTGYLLRNALQSGDKNLIAYSLGHLTHYITDVVGHPYVNQIAQSPYRLHHQRHHLVENFIDAYLWDRYHNLTPPVDPTSLGDAPLDTPTGRDSQKKPMPNAISKGSPMRTARLNDHISIGNPSLDNQLDAVINGACQDIQKSINNIDAWIGIQETITLDAPGDSSHWCRFMADTIANYCDEMKKLPTLPGDVVFENPEILKSGLNPRRGGYPTEDDVAEAYGVLRLMFRIQTEENVEEPKFPDIVGDITKIIEDTMKKVAEDIGSTPPVPTPNTSGSPSLKDLMNYLADLVEWTAEVVEHIGEALADMIEGIDKLEDAIEIETVKVLLWMLNSALYALYRYFRDILVVNAYSLPFTEELITTIGSLCTGDLWVSKGDLPNQQGSDVYPVAEYCTDKKHEDHSDRSFTNDYRPYEIPTQVQPGQVEKPRIKYTAPFLYGDCPEAFLEASAGPDNIFTKIPDNQTTPETNFTNFGGAIENSYTAINHIIRFLKQDKIDLPNLPNYDMDSDRGYGWLNWRPTDRNWKNLDPEYTYPILPTVNDPYLIK